MWESELQLAKDAAREAGSIIQRYFRDGVVMRTKESFNLVSDADVEAERAIVQRIQRTFPDHAILAEEEHAHAARAEHLWVVDPLDGTNNFAHKIPQFSVSVAYYRGGVAQCGVVYNPVRDDWHVAVAGQGAFFNGARTRVSEEARLGEALVGVGFYYDRGVKMESTLAAVGDLKRDHKVHGIRRFGAASLDLCM